jgi:hypothetical protein
MPRKVPLPRELFGTSFRSSASGFGTVGRERLRSADVAHPFHGVSAVGLDLESVIGLCRAYEPLLRHDQYFSHITAAALHGIPLPRSVGPLPLHISTVGEGAKTRRASVVGHVLSHAEVALAVGFPVLAPPLTWFHLSNLLQPNDLVAAGDFLITGARMVGGSRAAALCSVEDLAVIVAANAGHRGAVAAGWALPRLRTGADSPRESLLRLVLVAGKIPEPVIGLTVPVDSGRLVLHPDLALPEFRVVFEYEGEEHRTNRARFRRDIRRRELFEAANWRVIRVSADDLGPFVEQFLDRVREVLALREREKAHMGPSWIL